MDVNTIRTTNANPLSQWFRQPKIYISLPSQGNFYPSGALVNSETKEYAVYAMTAKDELMIKTPDALMSGQSTVELIKSCVPAIKDPWEMPSIDVDAVLVAIRIATYGDSMDVTADCPNCAKENDYVVELVSWLDKFRSFEFLTEIEYGPLTITVKPYTYRETTKVSIKTFEQQRILSIVNDENISDEVKIEKFNESFMKLTSLTIDTIADCVWKITTPDSIVTDAAYISDFIRNSPKDLFQLISTHITSMRQQMEMSAQTVSCTECNTEFVMPITLDQSTFFAQRS